MAVEWVTVLGALWLCFAAAALLSTLPAALSSVTNYGKTLLQPQVRSRAVAATLPEG
jgi:hypothetical protein